MTLQLAAPLGVQTPRIESVPPQVASSGQEVAELAEMAGLVLDPWQRHVLDGALGERGDGRWAAPEVGLIVPRQNGKGGVIEAVELAALFLFRERLVIHTAHEMKTSNEAFRRIRDLIEACPEFDSQVARVSTAHNEEGIELKSRSRLNFVARSERSGRGFTGDLVILDEAFALTSEQLAALFPTMITRPNWQLWYTSSAGRVTSEALRAVRNRGRAGETGLAYFEWSAPDDAASDDEAAWAQANPALGIRITRDSIAAALRVMENDPYTFRREHLGIWDDARGVPVIDLGVWAALADAESQARDPVVFALDANPEQAWGSIAVAGYREDDLPHVEVVEHRPGVDWIVARAVELQSQWSPAAWLLDPGGPAGALLTDLQDAGIEPELVTGRQMAQACGAFVAAAVAPERDRLRHLGQPSLMAAIAAAKKRTVGEAWAWGRKLSTEDISPLVAVTLALHGLAVHGMDPAANVW